MIRHYFVPYEFARNMEGIRFRYAAVYATSARHAEWLVIRAHRYLDVRVWPDRIVGI